MKYGLFVFNTLLLSLFFLLGSAYATDVGTCQAIDPSTDPVLDFNQNISLTSATCFNLSSSGVGHSVTINCHGYSVSAPVVSRVLFDPTT